MFKLPDGSLRLIVQGLARLTLDEVVATQPYLRARVSAAAEDTQRRRPPRDRRARAQHQDQLPAGRVAVAAAVGRPADAGDEHHRAGPPRRLHRLVASRRSARRSSRRCSRRSTSARGMDNLNRILIKELEVLELGSKIQSQVQSEVGKNQREYFLREQMKAIQKELGEGDDQTKEIEELAREDRGGRHARGRSRRKRCASSIACRRCRWPRPSTPCRARIWTGSSRCRGTSGPTK